MTVSGSVGRGVKVKRFETAVALCMTTPFPFCADETLKGHGAQWKWFNFTETQYIDVKEVDRNIYLERNTGTLLAHRFADSPWPGLYWAIFHVQKLATVCCLDPADFLIKWQKNCQKKKCQKGRKLCCATFFFMTFPHPLTVLYNPQVMSKKKTF